MIQNRKQEHRQSVLKMATYVFLFCVIGIILNIAGAHFAARFNLPLYLDSVGTVLIAVVGGYLPGVITGFLSNVK